MTTFYSPWAFPMSSLQKLAAEHQDREQRIRRRGLEGWQTCVGLGFALAGAAALARRSNLIMGDCLDAVIDRSPIWLAVSDTIRW